MAPEHVKLAAIAQMVEGKHLDPFRVEKTIKGGAPAEVTIVTPGGRIGDVVRRAGGDLLEHELLGELLALLARKGQQVPDEPAQSLAFLRDDPCVLRIELRPAVARF